MEKFRKSVNICQSYGQKYRGPFFDSQCTYVFIVVAVTAAWNWNILPNDVAAASSFRRLKID